MYLEFTKMEGCGNDYLYVDCRGGIPQGLLEAIPALSRRHFGVGGDGVICICASQTAHARMRMFNADGSEGAMCGNGIRCVAQWLYEHDLPLNTMEIETMAGIKTLRRTAPGQWQVDMGPASLDPASLPALGFSAPAVDQPLQTAGKQWRATLVSMGNPHCVVQVENTRELDLPALGPCFEKHPVFPQGVNTEFIRYISPTELEMRVWERGSGETLACGTGACAAAAAFVARGLCRKDQPITVHLLGGDLSIRVTDQTVWMTGPAKTVFEGRVQLDQIQD